ncbi:MAG: hypothetical protein IKP40_01605 [Clostridia bacterium]|nr:hypothetical protein [Clostridia bacterium]
MTNKLTALCFMLLLAALCCCAPASADDAELLRDLPGQWVYSGYVGETEEEEQLADLAFLTFEEGGRVTLRCTDPDGTHACACEGTWAFELVPNAMDRLTLTFTATDDPEQDPSQYYLVCVYDVYAEGWVESDTEHTYLLLEQVSCSGLSPFEQFYGDTNAALHRERRPNMRVVNCSEYVSLREQPSKSSVRLAKVPLGALVLAFPEAGVQSGFIWCVYHDEYGFILAEYLEEYREE